MAKAWLVTHPETELDKQGKVHGNLDPPLAHSGKLKAEQIAKKFQKMKVTQIHSSPRKRAYELAKLIAGQTGASVSVHPELVPWDLDSMSGAKPSAIAGLLDYFSSHPERPIPSGEAKNAVLSRYTKFMKRIKPGDVIVGHSQHSLALDYSRKGGNAAKVPMFGGPHGAGEIREIEV